MKNSELSEEFENFPRRNWLETSALASANFKGYISLEMEGKENAGTAVPKSLKLFREVFS